MPRYLVEHHSDLGLEVPANEETTEIFCAITDRSAAEHVVWLHSYVSADFKKSFNIYDAASPEAIKGVAARNRLPVDRITEVQVIVPRPTQ